MSAEALIHMGNKLTACGLALSTSGNLSARQDDAIFMTPTGKPLAGLEPEQLARLDLDGKSRNDVTPTKESALHLAVYRNHGAVQAIIHVHATHCVAASTLLEPGAWMPTMSPQLVFRAGRVPVLPYAPPGSDELVRYVTDCRHTPIMLLQNHGVVVGAADFIKAFGILEEAEENCRVWLLARGQGRALSDQEIEVLLQRDKT